jgi:hypothetical protein
VLAFATGPIADPTLFHIHRGAPGVAGPIVVDFVPLLPGGTGSVNVDRKVARAIVKEPSDCYFDIHNAEFPAEAVRGAWVHT